MFLAGILKVKTWSIFLKISVSLNLSFIALWLYFFKVGERMNVCVFQQVRTSLKKKTKKSKNWGFKHTAIL